MDHALSTPEVLVFFKAFVKVKFQHNAPRRSVCNGLTGYKNKCIVYTYIYMYICLNISYYICVRACVHTIHIDTLIYIYTYMYIYIYIYIYNFLKS